MVQYLKTVLNITPSIIVALSAIASIIGILSLFTDLNFGPLDSNEFIAIALGVFVVSVTIVLIRFELLNNEYNKLFGNDHARSLYKDGINISVDSYLSLCEGREL